jgi:hypothetical protein
VFWARSLFDTLFLNDLSALRQILIRHNGGAAAGGTLNQADAVSALLADKSGEETYGLHSLLVLLNEIFESPSVDTAPTEEASSAEDPLNAAKEQSGPSVIAEERPFRAALPFVRWALRLFSSVFVKEVNEVLAGHPVNATDENGAPFWSRVGVRAPVPEVWPDFLNGYKIACLREFVLWSAVIQSRVLNASSAVSWNEASDALDYLESIGRITSILEAEFNRTELPLLIAEQLKALDGSRRHIEMRLSPEVFKKVISVIENNFWL